LIAAAIIIAARVLPAPPDPNTPHLSMPVGETLIYRVTEKSAGESAITATKVVLSEHSFSESAQENGTNIILHTCREVRSDGAIQKWTFYYSYDNSNVHALSFAAQRFSPKGDLYYHEEWKFGDPFYKLPPDTAHLISFPFLLAGINFGPGKSITMHSWAQEGPATKILARFCGEERITVPWKTVNTWRVCSKADPESFTKPMGAFGKLFTQILPEFTIWFDKNTPHRPVKIHGVFGPLTPGKPEYIEELIKVTNG